MNSTETLQLEQAYTRSSCRLCKGRDLVCVLQLTPTPLADAYVPASEVGREQKIHALDLHMCERCGFVQLLEVVQPQHIYLDYLYKTDSSLGLVEHFGRYADEVVEELQPAAGSLVVDIGSNDGALLRRFQDHDMKVLGIDPAREIAAAATRKGIPTLPEFFTPALAERIRAEHGSAGVITSNNLVANVDDLDGLVDGIRALLADDGVFVFESFYLCDQIRNMVFDFTYHEHLSYFAVTPLEPFFQRHGLELIDARCVPTKGGSLRYVLQRSGGPRAVSPRVAERLREEEAFGVTTKATFDEFATRIDACKRDTVSRLKDLQSDGCKIVGYGASATSTTLVYHFGLGELLDHLVDDNPAKQGLYSPGLHLPVRASDELAFERPDVIVALAWRYYEPIVRRHRGLLESGTRVIVPLPELRELVAGSLTSP